MKHRISLTSLFLLVSLLLPLFANAQKNGYAVEIYDERSEDRTVVLKMIVRNQTTNQELDTITGRDITVLQDGDVLKDPKLQLNAVKTKANSKDEHSIAFSKAKSLKSSGATIGLVVDLSNALNKGNPAGVDYVYEIRQAAEKWMALGTDIAPADPEQIGIFLPLADNSQSLRPTGASAFSFDHNLMINAVRTEASRDGATDLYDAVLAAIEATSNTACERGTEGYVVVFSDGTISNKAEDPSEQIINSANDNKIKIIAIGIGKESNLQSDINRLPKIAPSTGGEYIQVASGDLEARMQDVYKQLVVPTDRTGYNVAFEHTAPRDAEAHTFQLQVTIDGQPWSSSILAIPDANVSNAAVGEIPLSDALTNYFLIAIPIIMILAGIATALASLGNKQRPFATTAERSSSERTRN